MLVAYILAMQALCGKKVRIKKCKNLKCSPK